MQRLYTTLLLLLYLASYSQDCNNSLSGKVIDLHDDSVLSGASIFIIENNSAAFSDIDGNYIIKNLCKDQSYSLKISHPACETIITRIITI